MRVLAQLIFALSVAAPGVAAAGSGCSGDGHALDVVQHIFDEADLDRDGVLSRSEYEGAGLQNFGVTFEESDLDSDGATSSDEYRELFEKHHPSHGATEA